MKTFIQWAGEEKKELPVYGDGKNENSKRSALATWMAPPQSGRGNYHPSYFLPSNADGIQKMQIGKKNSD